VSPTVCLYETRSAAAIRSNDAGRPDRCGGYEAVMPRALLRGQRISMRVCMRIDSAFLEQAGVYGKAPIRQASSGSETHFCSVYGLLFGDASHGLHDVRSRLISAGRREWKALFGPEQQVWEPTRTSTVSGRRRQPVGLIGSPTRRPVQVDSLILQSNNRLASCALIASR
jgi:hypothetical protein